MSSFALPYPHFWYWTNAKDFRPIKVDKGYFTPIVPSEFDDQLLHKIYNDTLSPGDVRRRARDDLQPFFNRRYLKPEEAAALYFGCNPDFVSLDDEAFNEDKDASSRELRGYIKLLRDKIVEAQSEGKLSPGFFLTRAFRDWAHMEGLICFFLDEHISARPDDNAPFPSVSDNTDVIKTAVKEKRHHEGHLKRQYNNLEKILLGIIAPRNAVADSQLAKTIESNLALLVSPPESYPKYDTILKRLSEIRALALKSHSVSHELKRI